MTDDLSPTQALALWGLLARQGRAMNAELKPALKAADRSVLADKKLLTVEKSGRSFELSLTKDGREWAKTHFDAPLPLAYKALSDLLVRLSVFLNGSGLSLDQVIGQAPERPSPPPPAPRSPKATELRKLIEDAYLSITGGKFDESVRLSRLRTELAPHSRKTIDTGLRRISKAKRERARLGQLSDNKAIDAAERDSAFVSEANESFHLLWIQP